MKYLSISLLITGSIALLTVYQSYFYYEVVLGGRIALLIGLLLVLLKGFLRQIINREKLNDRTKNLGTLSLSIFVLLLLLEIVFTLIPRSHGVGFAYAARNWQYYYQHNNEMGFRDSSVAEKDFTKDVILFLGDSFTAGAGIKHPEDRFANLLHQKIKDCFELMICAKGGMNTSDQLAVLKGLAFKPEIIIFQYYGNDIEGDAKSLGRERKQVERYADLNFFSLAIVRSSYFFNYLYWLFPRDYLNGYQDYLIENYNDHEVFTKHAATLRALTDYCKHNGIRMYCIVIPFLQNMEESKSLYTTKVSSILDDSLKSSKVINLEEELAAIPVTQRVVNNNDAHANEYVNTVIAKKLHRELGLLCD